MVFTIALIGRPNVGKSTLFNRLAQKKLALVHDEPGVTRDWRETTTNFADHKVRLIDTAGLEDAFDQSLEARMRKQTETAAAEADLVLFIIDSRVGLTPLDEHFAQWLHEQNYPVMLLANKCEGKAGDVGYYESYKLGLGDPQAVSAEHSDGISSLIQDIIDHIEATTENTKPESTDRPTLQMAIVGRPNVGKSTLINRLLGTDRLLTGPEAGITRDSISVDYEHKGKKLRLFDTAGLRRKTKIKESLEKLSSYDTLRAIRFAQVVVLLLDAQEILDKQELTIARQVTEEGRALIIGLNKWDLIKNEKDLMEHLRFKLEHSLPQIQGVPFVKISGLRGYNLDDLLDTSFEMHDLWSKRLGTSELNRWLSATTEAHPPPLSSSGRRIKMKFMTQAKTRPPTFMVSSNKEEDDIPSSYKRYLINQLRKDFSFWGVPIRLTFRTSDNPFAKK